MNFKKKHLLMPILLVMLVLSACTDESSDEASDNQLSIITSFFPVYEFTQKVAGDKADISMMIGSGVDPHGYEPSAQNIAEVSNADMLVYSSEDMEFWISSLLNTIESDDLKVVRTADGLESDQHYEVATTEVLADNDAVESVSDAPYDVTVLGVAGHYHSGDNVTLAAQYDEADEWQWFTKHIGQDWELMTDQTDGRFEYELESDDFYVQAVALNAEGEELAQSEVERIHIDDHEGEDPHIWLDPILAQDQVRQIEEALIEIDPDNEAYYSENAQQFIDELQELHEDYEEAFEQAENRTFVVQHQAFGYIAARYNLEQVAIGGLSTEVEPSPSRIAEINSLVNEVNVPVIYYQQGADSSIAQTVADETGTETAVLHDLETLSDELRENDLGYIEAMRENLEALKISIN
ncbi:metal ABC transporter solute-binding protein, Zn/Mn family [Alkalibacterium sp.]|nr:MAG: hypothetical protein EA249_06250 [Alkalibacterium sp.]